MTTTTLSKTGREIRVSDELKNQILSALLTAAEPATNDEIITKMRMDGVEFSPYMVKRGLFELARDGMIGARSESRTERGVRSPRGIPAQGVHSLLYWPGAMVPERVSPEVIEGVRLRAGRSLNNGGAASKAARSKKKRPAKALQMQTGTLSNERPAKAPAVQTGNRIERLESRIVKLEKTIENLMKALS